MPLSRGIASLIFTLANFQAPVAILPCKNPGTHRLRGWVGPITGLNVFAKRKNLSPGGIRTPHRPANRQTITVLPTSLSPLFWVSQCFKWNTSTCYLPLPTFLVFYFSSYVFFVVIPFCLSNYKTQVEVTSLAHRRHLNWQAYDGGAHLVLRRGMHRNNRSRERNRNFWVACWISYSVL